MHSVTPQTINKKHIIFTAIVLIQLGLFFFLYQRANWLSPPGHVHAMENADTFYPDIIRQAKLGAWSYRYQYSTLPAQPVYTFLFFIAAGKIAAVFNIDPVVMYEITRVTGGVAILLATYWLITLFLPTAIQIPAMIFTMVFETGPQLSDVLHAPIWNWTGHEELILIIRRFWLPHHLWGEALGLILLCVIVKTIKKPSWIGPILIIILSIASPLCDPTYVAILVPCVFIPWLLYAAATKTLKRVFPPILLSVVGVLCVALFTKSQFSADIRLSHLLADEKTWWTNEFIFGQFFQSFGLFYPFVAVILVLTLFSFRKWSENMQRTFILSLSWSVLPVGLIFLSALPWTPLINGRIAMDLSTVPIGILSAHIFYAAEQFPWFKRPIKLFVNGLFLLGLCFSLVLSVVYVRQIMKKQDDEVYRYGYSWTLYPTNNIWNSMMALKQIPQWSHIMINPRIGDVLPAFVPVIVYQGNPYTETDWIPRRGLSYEFYRGDMPHSAAVKLLTDNAISYVYYGVEEKGSTVTHAFYPDLLTPFYTNPDVTIYKVKPL